MAPSAVNRQPWKFVIVRSKEAREKLWRAYDREWFRTAPLYIVCMKNNNECWTRRYDDKKHGDMDVSIATEHLCLAAAERGLGTCWVCNCLYSCSSAVSLGLSYCSASLGYFGLGRAALW